MSSIEGRRDADQQSLRRGVDQRVEGLEVIGRDREVDVGVLDHAAGRRRFRQREDAFLQQVANAI